MLYMLFLLPFFLCFQRAKWRVSILLLFLLASLICWVTGSYACGIWKLALRVKLSVCLPFHLTLSFSFVKLNSILLFIIVHLCSPWHSSNKFEAMHLAWRKRLSSSSLGKRCIGQRNIHSINKKGCWVRFFAQQLYHILANSSTWLISTFLSDFLNIIP